MHLPFLRPRHLVIAIALLLPLALTACQPVHPVTPEPGAAESGTTEAGAESETPIPEVLIFIDDAGINVRTEFPNGIVAVTVENRTDTPLDVGFTRIPEGTDVEELKALADDFMGNLLPLLESASFMYSFNPVPAGESGRAIIDFGAGGSFLADATEHSEGGAPIPNAPHLYTEFQANWPNDAAPPQADVVVKMQDFSYEMPDSVPAGELLWEFENVGEQWHMAFVIKPEPGMTTDELLAIIEAAESEEDMSGPPPFEIIENGGTPPISVGERVWVNFALEPGEYIIGCPIPDVASLAAGGPPVSHFAHGMYHTLTVE